MHCRRVQRVLPTADTKESGTLLESLRPKSRHLFQVRAALKSSVPAAPGDYVPCQHRSYAGNVRQQVRGCRIQVHAHAVDAGLHGIVQFLLQKHLVHVVLVLPYSEVLGIYLHKLRKRVHEPAANTHRTADRNVLVRELLAGDLRRAVNGRAVLAYRPYLAALRQLHLTHEFLRLARGGAVAYRYRLNAVFLQHALNRHQRLDLLVLRRMREDDGMVQQAPLLVQARNLAAVPESRIYSHGTLLPDGGLQKQLPQVLAEHLYGLDVGTFLGLTYDFPAYRRFQQPLERIGHGILYLIRQRSAGIALRLAEVVVDLVAALLRVGVEGNSEETFVLGAQDGQQIMGRHAVQRHLEIEVSAVFGGVRIVFRRLCGL